MDHYSILLFIQYYSGFSVKKRCRGGGVHAETVVLWNAEFIVCNIFIFPSRCQGTIGHCKILHRKSGYGFSEPHFKHSSLVQLVIHYQHESLKDHNPTLDIRLLYPVRAAHDTIYTTREPVYLHMNQNYWHTQRLMDRNLFNTHQILHSFWLTYFNCAKIVGECIMKHTKKHVIYCLRTIVPVNCDKITPPIQ